MRVLVVDDHPLIHEIMPAILARALGEVTVFTAVALEDGIKRAGADAPDLVLLDLGLPGCEGLDSLSRFRGAFPQLPVVVLSAVCDRRLIIAALEAGVAGYIPKTSKPDVIVAALKLVAAGATYVPREALEGPAENVTPRRRRVLDFTQRQQDVLRLMLKGYNNERIATELAIAPSTVKQHTHAIFNALGVSTRAEAVVAATHRGLDSQIKTQF